jgi:SAM-dependent methyltransferase
MTPTCPFEPLDRLARFSWDWAPALCRPAHGCLDYHRPWSLVRLLELGGALPASSEFFERELAPLAALPRPRVLVSGGADTGVTAMTVMALRNAGAEPSIVFVDRCATTCRQNELFAAEAGIDLQVVCSDVTLLDMEPVDAVVSHSFLHYFPMDGRHAVMRAWARSLRPGGRVVMRAVAALDEAHWRREKDPGDIAVRRDRLAGSARAIGFGDAQVEELAATAARFWAARPGQPPALTEANLRVLLESNGFALQSLALPPAGGTRGPRALPTRDTHPSFHAEAVALKT